MSGSGEKKLLDNDDYDNLFRRKFTSLVFVITMSRVV